MLIVFNIIAYNSVTNKIYFAVMVGTTLLSIFLSFLIVNLKYKKLNEKTIETRAKKFKINPFIKSTVYDYLTPDFFATLIFCSALFMVFIIEFSKNINLLYEMEIQLFYFIFMTILFSIGFIGIVDSVPKINWKFQAIISPNDFRYHVKRTMFILCGILGWLFVPFIIIGSIINPMFLLKYLYCIFVIFLISINIAFTISNKLTKIITLSFIIALTIWISTLQTAFLLILIIPVFYTHIKAKDEYREWSLL